MAELLDIPRLFADKFARDASEATTIKAKIIAERNLAVASCVIALEDQQPQRSRDIYEQALIDQGIEPTGAVDTENWHDTVRAIAANIGPVPAYTNPLKLLIDLSLDEAGYLDLSVASHPSGTNTTRLFY